MIHLDTNFPIGLLVSGSRAASEVSRWLAAGEPIGTSSIAWCEFLNGPVTAREVSRVVTVLQARIIPFGEPEAVLAADLFNRTGRRWGSRFDCLIAATAMRGQANLATENTADFRPFAAHGLALI